MSEPKIFNKATVLIFSILGSTFYGGLIYSTNLKTLNKGKFIAPTITFSILWSIVLIWLFRDFEYPLIKYLVINGLGGLILIIPLWNYHFPDLDQFENRKIWGPLAGLLLPWILFFSLHWINRPKKKSYEEKVNDFYALSDSAAQNSIFILNDSVVNFEGLLFTFPSYSYYYTVNSEIMNMIYSTIYFEEGDFSFKCLTVKLNEGETLSIDLLKNKVDTLFLTDSKKYSFATSSSIGKYETYEGDTLFARGQFVLYGLGNTGYMLTTDYPMLNSDYGDSISDYIFSKINHKKTVANKTYSKGG